MSGQQSLQLRNVAGGLFERDVEKEGLLLTILFLFGVLLIGSNCMKLFTSVIIKDYSRSGAAMHLDFAKGCKISLLSA